MRARVVRAQRLVVELGRGRFGHGEGALVDDDVAANLIDAHRADALQGQPHALERQLRIAAALQVQRHTVALWRQRITEQGIGAVWEITPGRGRKPRYDKARVARVVEATLQTKPAAGTHWSLRPMAKAQGLSKSSVHRIWQDHQIKPHLTRSFKLSRHP